MTGPEHWTEADQILTDDPCEYGCPHSGCQHEMRQLVRAQVHATLALAAAPVRAHVRGDAAALSDGLFGYQSEEVAEAFTEWCAAAGIEARDDQEYRWLRQAFTAGLNEAARYGALGVTP
jgi:hypothetical protein